MNTTFADDDLLRYRNRLRFPSSLEADYQAEYIHAMDALVRPNLIGAISIVTVLCLVDLWAAPQSWRIIWVIRAMVICALAFIIYISRKISPGPWLMRWRGAAILSASLGMVAVLGVIQLTEIGFYLYLSLLIVILAATPMGLPLRYTAAVSMTTVVAYLGVAIFRHHMLDTSESTALFIADAFLLTTATIASVVGGYFTEIGHRRDFLQTRIIEEERARSEGLLLNILPASIALRLKRNEVVADYYPSASVLFADIVNFTPMAAAMTPPDVVALLNEVFSFMDTLVDRYELEKIKTIGDCYMVAAGVPVTRPDHAQVLVRMALELEAYLREHLFQGDRRLAMRIGIHSGPLIAGIAGHKKFSYDLWGDTVNTASRMESHGTSGYIQVSRSTYELIQDSFACEARGVIQVKGKGEMEVWHVTGLKT